MAAVTIVVQDNRKSAAQMARELDKTRKQRVLTAIMNYLKRLVTGTTEAYLTVQVAAAFATATVTCTRANAVDGTDILTLDGVALAMVANPTTDLQWARGATDATMAANLATRINTNPTTQKTCRAKAIANVCHIFCIVPGLLGNRVPLAETGAGMVISGALLAGGASDEADSHAFGFNPQL